MTKSILTTLFLGICVFLNASSDEGSNFSFLDAKVNVDHKMISFTTVGENGKYSFYIEQFINEEWIVVKHFSGKGTFDTTNYEVEIPILVKGDNKFRIKKENNEGLYDFSKVFELENYSKRIHCFLNENSDQIEFSSNAYFELKDAEGNVTKNGITTIIELNSMPVGEYSLWYNNRLVFVTISDNGTSKMFYNL